MRKITLMLLLIFFSIASVMAQTRTITGRVTDKEGAPVPFASVSLNNSKTGVSADAYGTYSIKVKDGDVLTISGSGYTPATENVGTRSVISTVLAKSTTSDLKEVVVTSAFNIKTSLKAATSNVQSVNSEQLNTVRTVNINNALAGKVAGVQVQSQSAAMLGRETKVRLRGENGLGVGRGALYVVDGTILPSGGDINTDDVEDVSVLQGPAAAALFGPDGANGAIVVTTKKAKRGAGIGVEVNSAVVFDRVYIYPNFQNTYAGGSGPDLIQYHYKTGDPVGWKALDGKYYHNYDDDASWGPRMMGQEYIPWYAWYDGHEASFKTASLTPQPNNVRDFFNTGVTATNNVSFTKSTEQGTFRLSYTNLDIKGLVPNSYLKRNTLNTSFSYDITPRLNVAANINFLTQNRNSESDDGYSNASTGSFSQWFHRDLDMGMLKSLRGLRTAGGVYASWNISNPDTYDAAHPDAFYKANYWFNPFAYFDLVKNFDQRNRLFGDVGVTYKFTNNLKARLTYRRQQLNTNQYNIYPTEMELSSVQASFNPYNETTAEGVLAAYQSGQSSAIRQNIEGLLSYSKKYKDFGVNANLGFDILKSTSRSFNANTSGGLAVPGVYSLANSVNPLRNVFGSGLSGIGLDNFGQLEVINQFTRRAVFGTAAFSYRNLAFIDGTYRRDYSSTEPKGHYVNTKSIGASFVVSELFPKNNFLTFAKLRASAGEILELLNPYELGLTYSVTNNYIGNPIMTIPNTVPSSDLHGSANSEKEAGVDLRFWKNRIGVSATYWERTNKDFPLTIGVSTTSGFTNTKTNTGEIAKKGIDMQGFVDVFRNKNFNWRLSGTWGLLIKNEVVSIVKDGSITAIVSGGGAFSPNTSTSTRAAWITSAVGKPWGMLTGTGIKRINGVPVLNPDGTYQAQTGTDYGTVLPNYTGGIQNSFTIFKNFTVNVNVDYSYGGKFFSLSQFWGSFSGLTANTAVLNDKGNSVRDAVEDGGGVHVVGVDDQGKAMDKYVDAQTYFHQFNGANISEASVYDLTFVKMRELSIGYKVPMDKLSIGKFIKGATFSVVARNPWLIYAKTRDFDPSEISNVYGEDGQAPGTRSIGFNVKLNF